MIVLTGAAGFIGSCLASHLYRLRYKDLVLVDDFSREDKQANLAQLAGLQKIDRNEFFNWLDASYMEVEMIIHLGARTDTTEFDYHIFEKLNINYSKTMWQKCVEYGLPLIYASSAATYGGGEHGYSDSHALVDVLQPLNPYGESKNEFDKWALAQEQSPYFWVGLKFFNVYGPNEYHKGRMASVVLHAYNQVQQNGKVKLFRSHRPDFENGKQLRDFVYVKDVNQVITHFLEHRTEAANGLYNLGTGKAQTFLDLANSLFAALKLEPKIEFVDTPEDIRDKYQYFTEANIEKLRNNGYHQPFMSLEEGVEDYVTHYLEGHRYY
ncbi:ADP-glyceromanno-heptose 6-epimerase [bacterium]|nr:ADP-glyceromanno-heptose 6-epimerase [bacterium]